MIYPIIWGAVCRTVVDNVTVQAITGRGSVTELPQKWLHPEDTAPSTPAQYWFTHFISIYIKSVFIP